MNFLPAGPTTAILYVLFLLAVSIVIALLHLGGSARGRTKLYRDQRCRLRVGIDRNRGSGDRPCVTGTALLGASAGKTALVATPLVVIENSPEAEPPVLHPCEPDDGQHLLLVIGEPEMRAGRVSEHCDLVPRSANWWG